MRRMTMNRVAGLAALGLAASVAFASAGVAQSVSGQAYGAYVSTPTGGVSQSPLAVLPSGTDGDVAAAEADAVGVAGALSASFLNSVSSGGVGAAQSGAQSAATLGNTSILNGVICASGIT